MDMRYHWLTNRFRQKQFDVYWRPGRENLGDYHTKHHSAQHHKYVRYLILHEENSLQVLRGCGKLLTLPQPPCAPTRTHGQIQAPREPPSLGACSRACTLSLDRNKLLLLSHNFSNVMINSTSLNEAH
jgi:hypothetical protein